MSATMTIDECDAKRTTLLCWYGVAFAVWAGALAAVMVLIVGPGLALPPTRFPTLSGEVVAGLVVLQIIAFGAWAVLLARLASLGRKVAKDPVLRAAARDERSRRNQRDAFVLAFWVVIVAAGLTIPLEVGLGIVLTASTFASVAIWLGVSTALLAYVLMERRDAA